MSREERLATKLARTVADAAMINLRLLKFSAPRDLLLRLSKIRGSQ